MMAIRMEESYLLSLQSELISLQQQLASIRQQNQSADLLNMRQQADVA